MKKGAKKPSAKKSKKKPHGDIQGAPKIPGGSVNPKPKKKPS